MKLKNTGALWESELGETPCRTRWTTRTEESSRFSVVTMVGFFLMGHFVLSGVAVCHSVRREQTPNSSLHFGHSTCQENRKNWLRLCQVFFLFCLFCFFGVFLLLCFVFYPPWSSRQQRRTAFCFTDQIQRIYNKGTCSTVVHCIIHYLLVNTVRKL